MKGHNTVFVSVSFILLVVAISPMTTANLHKSWSSSTIDNASEVSEGTSSEEEIAWADRSPMPTRQRGIGAAVVDSKTYVIGGLRGTMTYNSGNELLFASGEGVSDSGPYSQQSRDILLGVVFDANANTEGLASIDPSTGTVTSIGSGITDWCWSGGPKSALEPSNGVFYFHGKMCSDPLDSERLFAFDTQTGVLLSSPLLPDHVNLNFIELELKADVGIGKVADPPIVTQGDLVGFTVTYSNTGNLDAEDVIITDTLPSGLAYHSNDVTCDEDTPGQITCNLGSVALESSGSFVITATVNISEVLHTTFTNSVTIDTTTPQVRLENNEAQATGLFITPDVNLSASDQSEEGPPGTTVSYNVGIMNTGTYTDRFDLTISGNAWATTLSVSTTQWLALGESTNVTLTVTVAPDAADGTMDVVTLTATSRWNQTVLASVDLTTVSRWYNIYLPVGLKNSN